MARRQGPRIFSGSPNLASGLGTAGSLGGQRPGPGATHEMAAHEIAAHKMAAHEMAPRLGFVSGLDSGQARSRSGEATSGSSEPGLGDWLDVGSAGGGSSGLGG
jgi:hypothetical protein